LGISQGFDPFRLVEAPRYVRTGLVDGLIAQGRLDASRIETRTPLGRMIRCTLV
jgi:hypothetical protein